MGKERYLHISLRNQFSREGEEAKLIHVTSESTNCIKTKDLVKKQLRHNSGLHDKAVSGFLCCLYPSLVISPLPTPEESRSCRMTEKEVNLENKSPILLPKVIQVSPRKSQLIKLIQRFSCH